MTQRQKCLQFNFNHVPENYKTDIALAFDKEELPESLLVQGWLQLKLL